MSGLLDTVTSLVEPFQQLLFGVALCSLRFLAAFMVLPATGSQFLQGRVRSGLVFLLALFVALGLPDKFTLSLDASTLALFGLKEAGIGLVLGFAASSVFWVAESVGALIDTQAGFNSVQLSNPMSGEQSTPVSNLLSQLVVAVFYLIGGLLSFVQVMFKSFELWPVYRPLPEFNKITGLFVVQQTDTLMETTMKFAAPMLLVLLLIDLAFGFISRTADKLQPSSLSQPIKGAVTMLMLALVLGVMMDQVSRFLLPTGLLTHLQSQMGMK